MLCGKDKSWNGSSWVWGRLIGLLLIAPHAVFGADQDAVARQIHETIKQTHAVLIQRQDQKQRHHDRTGVIENQVARLKDEIASLEASLAADREAVTTLEAQDQQRRFDQRRYAQFLHQIATAVKPHVQIALDRVREGIPFHRGQRTKQLERITTDLENPDPEPQGQAVIGFLDFIGNELRLSRSVQMWNEPVLLEDSQRQVHAYQIRFGLVHQVFVSEDRSLLGLAAMEQRRLWRLDATPQHRRQIMQAMRILQKQRPAEIVSVSIPTRPGKHQNQQGSMSQDDSRD